jgi:4'-phosphopantetheinyl transferase
MKQVNDFVCGFSHESFSDDASVRVWFADLDRQQTDIGQLSWLSTSEHTKASRFKSPLQRQRYLAGRVFTRRTLSGVTGLAPEVLEIITDQCGKPCLSPPAVGAGLPSKGLLSFNVSHSENFLCIATALGGDIGIDLEVVNPDLDLLAISQACLDQDDNDQIRCSPPNERSLVFYRLWTRREAFAKMLGHGVDSSHVLLTPTPPWTVRSLELTLEAKQIVGSLAIAAPTASSASDS